MKITEILPSACAVLGVPGFDDTLGLADRAGPVERIVVILVDGLGHGLLPRAARSAPLLAELCAGRLGRVDELSCMLPSTTPTSLVSLGTGVGPGRHGVIGFRLNVPGTERVISQIHWRDDPPPRSWQPVPTVFARAAAAGLSSTVVLPESFAGSGLTVAAYGGARFVGLADPAELAAAVLHALSGDTRLVYGYTARVDTAAHAHGVGSPEWARACAGVGTLLERLLRGLPPATALLVTADHGGFDVPRSARVDIADDARLSAGVRLVAGEPRLRYLHTREGAAADVCATWSGVLGGRATVLLREQAVASGMFGPVEPHALARIGDVVVLCEGDAAIMASGYEPPETDALVGMHGGRTPIERAIPLITLPGR